ncbi:class I SAM-dependent methyltransferase [Marinobacterium marinum]|uniref:Class I SAM-dependent methyltransferase n=1 Tax=Marinobacterium marinum TaxID=2756129 RepID=A0A7W2ACP0_9GAMM|nr:class I SAM-dependent methyltransferase [Marinobacterium marinum]MBA4502709.1 class I SAM-dependent methyltransferase [Marinobacterium marinum]
MTIDLHYQQQLDTPSLLEQVRTCYPSGADLYQLAPLDQLHIGGIKASERLLRHLDHAHHQYVLDVGSGAGGLMRQASARGVNMIGLDITHDLNRLNKGLNRLYSEPVDNPILTGDAHHLPFSRHSLDLILFQHSFLNMPDALQVLRECHRVLKPDGQLIMHEVVLGSHADAMRFPVPWADDPQHSHLLSKQALVRLLQEAGFSSVQTDDWSDEAQAWRRRQHAKETAGAPAQAPLSPAMILGNRFRTMGSNVMLNLEADAIRVLEVLATPVS